MDMIKSLVVRATAAAVVTIAPLIACPAVAGIPVIDGTNLSQNAMTAVESVTQTLKQIQQYATQLQQYETQLQQYENMVRNTAAPAFYVWDQAETTMNRLRGTIDTLNYYKERYGSVDGYMGRFRDVGSYRGSPCFSSSGCSDADWAAMQDSVRLGSEAQLRALDALVKGLDQQQDALASDARQLGRLQAGAQGASGQMQAIQAANQLASNQANQLLQIRALLIAQQNAEATRDLAAADRAAKEAAASAQLRAGAFVPSTGRTW